MAARKTECASPDSLLNEAIEVLPGRLYFLVVNNKERIKYTQSTHYFAIDDDLVYEPFYEDFGPLNIAQLNIYCELVQIKLTSKPLEKKKIIHYTQSDAKKRVNSAFLMGCYLVLHQGKDPTDVYEIMTQKKAQPYALFRDASIGVPQYTISLLDCFKAIAKGRECGFYNPRNFSVDEYGHYEAVQNGDLNWIIPDKILAFAGPQSLEYRAARVSLKSVTTHTPESFLNYFKANNVTAVVRLNGACYQASKFTDANINHYDLIFDDGGLPPDEFVTKFLDIVENTTGAIAVHCKAGLGRTGSLIACYLMKWYHFTAREAIAWLRICRPASIIGHQQTWLEMKQPLMWIAGRYVTPPVHKNGIYSREGPARKRILIHGTSARSLSRTLSPSRQSLEDSTASAARDSLSTITSKVTSMNIVESNIKSADMTQGDRLQKIKNERLTDKPSTRCSWAMPSSTQKRGFSTSWPPSTAAAQRGLTSAKRAAKKVLPRKKVGSAIAKEENTPDSTTRRRSPRVIDNRQRKSALLR